MSASAAVTGSATDIQAPQPEQMQRNDKEEYEELCGYKIKQPKLFSIGVGTGITALFCCCMAKNPLCWAGGLAAAIVSGTAFEGARHADTPKSVEHFHNQTEPAPSNASTETKPTPLENEKSN
ncbi:hypothetical protein [Parashewanella tropica]|uniref:hypothetical protein n=1 Tax=Parashewanella tropica TaxID=2547970 RepID=UPI0010599F9D|nr:hypothetical protein [Parashewanella tropica]